RRLVEFLFRPLLPGLRQAVTLRSDYAIPSNAYRCGRVVMLLKIGVCEAGEKHTAISRSRTIDDSRRPLVLPVPDVPSVIERRRRDVTLEPAYAAGQHNFFGELRACAEQVPAGLGMIKIGAQ